MRVFRGLYRFDPKSLVSGLWPCTRDSGSYLKLRAAIWTVFSSLLLLNLYQTDMNRHYFFIYLTNWALLLLLAKESLMLYVNYKYWRFSVASGRSSSSSEPDDEDEQRFFEEHSTAFKALFLMDNTSSVTSIQVSIFYWALLFDPAGASGGSPSRLLNFYNCFDHIFNSLMTLFDVLVSDKQYSFDQFLFPMAFQLGYLIFAFLYSSVAGKTNNTGDPFIYASLDFRKGPGKIGLTVTFFVCLGMLVQVSLLVVNKAKALSLGWKDRPKLGEPPEATTGSSSGSPFPQEAVAAGSDKELEQLEVLENSKDDPDETIESSQVSELAED